MPRQVDHDARRSEVAEVACALIASEGVEATTVRRVAEAAQCSTTIVSHYFANKHQLLLFAYRAAAVSTQAMVNSVVEKIPQTCKAVSKRYCRSIEPDCETGRSGLLFWGMVIGDAEFAREHRHYFRHAVTLTVSVMKAKWGQRAFGDGDGCENEARRLFALVSGLAAQTVFDPRALTAQSIRDIIATEIRRMAPAGR